jgi:hypothetical protein
MNLKTLHLLYPIKLPWSVHYSEFVEPRDDWKASIEGGLIYIRQAGITKFIISAAMLRFAEVADEPVANATVAAPTSPATPLSVMDPVQAKAIEQTFVKRRPGRPPKAKLV